MKDTSRLNRRNPETFVENNPTGYTNVIYGATPPTCEGVYENIEQETIPAPIQIPMQVNTYESEVKRNFERNDGSRSGANIVKILRKQNKIYKDLIALIKKTYRIPDDMLDEQKNIILPEKALKGFIADMLETSHENILIICSCPDDVGCCGFRENLVKKVERIKIKIHNPDDDTAFYRNFEMFYSDIYNKITEECKISLRKIYNV
jgi:hypothetical protein